MILQIHVQEKSRFTMSEEKKTLTGKHIDIDHSVLWMTMPLAHLQT